MVLFKPLNIVTMADKEITQFANPDSQLITTYIGSTRVNPVIWESITARNYIQNGLIAMWDGIENVGWGQHDNSATVWKDLVGESNGTLSNDVSWGDAALLVTSNCFPCIVPQSVGNVLHTGRFTIEIVNKSSNRNRRGTLFGNYNIDQGSGFNIEWRYGNGTNYTYRTYFNSSPDISTTELYLVNVGQSQSFTLNGRTHNMYHNAVRFYSTTTTIHTPAATRYCIGGELLRNNMASLGEIYSVRIYSLDLSEEEIAHNYKIDKIRFGL